MKKRHIVTGAFALLATLQSPEIAELDKGLIGRLGTQTNPTATTPADNKKLSKSTKKEAKKTEHKANDPEFNRKGRLANLYWSRKF